MKLAFITRWEINIAADNILAQQYQFQSFFRGEITAVILARCH